MNGTVEGYIKVHTDEYTKVFLFIPENILTKFYLFRKTKNLFWEVKESFFLLFHYVVQNNKTIVSLS